THEVSTELLPATIFLESLLQTEPVIPDDSACGRRLRHAALDFSRLFCHISPHDAPGPRIACCISGDGAVTHETARKLQLLPGCRHWQDPNQPGGWPVPSMACRNRHAARSLK